MLDIFAYVAFAGLCNNYYGGGRVVYRYMCETF